jgi:hypothetical protein
MFVCLRFLICSVELLQGPNQLLKFKRKRDAPMVCPSVVLVCGYTFFFVYKYIYVFKMCLCVCMHKIAHALADREGNLGA